MDLSESFTRHRTFSPRKNCINTRRWRMSSCRPKKFIATNPKQGADYVLLKAAVHIDSRFNVMQYRDIDWDFWTYSRFVYVPYRA
jgi:hypothetical protein